MQKIQSPSDEHTKILTGILSWKNKSFCVRPFLSVTAHQDGAYRLCCEDERIVEGQKLGNIMNLKIPEMIKSPKMMEIRKKMLQGKVVDECSRCRLKESRGIASLREKSNTEYFHKFVQDIVYSSDAITWNTSHPSLHADIRFSNICNLSCRMCYSGSSSSRRELDQRLWNVVHEVVQDIWTIPDFSSIADELRYIYIAWGEPFLDKNFIPLLDFLIDSWRSKDISITVNTNLTVFSETHRELLSYFRDVRIVASCDWYGKMYEYIRLGAKWDTFLKNILSVKKSLVSFWKWSWITVNTVVQIDNVINILQLYAFCHKIWVKNNLSILQVPDSMYLWVLPYAQRIKVLDIYKKFILENSSSIPDLKNKFSEIMTILSSEQEQKKWLYAEFLKQKKIIDLYASETNK